jgi:hypothetical protein
MSGASVSTFAACKIFTFVALSIHSAYQHEGVICMSANLIRDFAVTLTLCASALGVAYVVTEGHRYDVVAVGAGSGGSQTTEGSTDFKSYLIDHRTGKTWTLEGGNSVAIPTVVWSCKQAFPKNDAACAVQ